MSMIISMPIKSSRKGNTTAIGYAKEEGIKSYPIIASAKTWGSDILERLANTNVPPRIN